MGNINFYRFLAWGFLVISCYFSWHVLYGYGTTPLEGFIYACTGILLVLAGLGCLMKAYHFYQDGSQLWIICALIYCVTSLISINFTTSSMGMTDIQSKMGISKANTQFNSISSDIAAIDRQIETLQKTAEEYRKINRFTYGVRPTQDKISELRAEKAELVNALSGIDIEANAKDAVFTAGAKFLNVSGEDMRSFIVHVIALFIELLAGWMFMLVEMEKAKRYETQPIVLKNTGTPAGNGHKKQQALTGQASEPQQAQKPLGLQMNKKVNSDAMETYINYAYDPDGMKGINAVAQLTGMKQREIIDARNTLIDRGLIKTEGRKTVPQVGKQQMLEEARA